MSIRALTFDVFGTLVDWRGSIATRASALGVDGDEFAVRWARKYAEYVHSGKPWRKLEFVLADAGLELAKAFGIKLPLPEGFGWQWNDLAAWPDVVEGMRRLRTKFTCVALSNADSELAEMLSRNSGIGFDRIIGNECIRAYKPDRRVYRTAAAILDLEPAEIMMVAAHLFDLRGAKKNGFQTAFIRRPGEDLGDPETADYVDVIANDLFDLDAQLRQREAKS